jgi:hypothetical protein
MNFMLGTSHPLFENSVLKKKIKSTWYDNAHIVLAGLIHFFTYGIYYKSNKS